MSKCHDFDAYMGKQRDELESEIAKNKWYLSEQEGRDVGEIVATEDYLEQHLNRFAEEFRRTYCQKECRYRDACDIADRVEEMRSYQELIADIKEDDEGSGSAGTDFYRRIDGDAADAADT